jgi:hypothetical protein
MKRLWMSGAAAMMAVSFASVNAQTPQNPPQTPQTQQQRPAQSMDNQQTTTVTGCVYEEKAIPGRSPNVAEQAGVLEDYILVASADTKATAGTTGTTPPAGTAGTTGTAALKHKAFKLEHADDEKLKTMVGKRVEVTGKIDAEASDYRGTAGTPNPTKPTNPPSAPAQDRSMGPDQIELPEFEVTSIREVAGTCPATPDIKK